MSKYKRQNHPTDPIEEIEFLFLGNVVCNQEIEAVDKRRHHRDEKLECSHIDNRHRLGRRRGPEPAIRSEM